MASTKKSPRPQKGKKKKAGPKRNYHRLLSPLLLLSILLFSLLAAGYVIFFRTVVAGELQQEDVGKGEIKETTGEAAPPAKRDLPKVAIIIDDLGYNEEIAMAFLDLPIELTYSFLPFAPYTKKLARLAHRRGKTVFLHLPLEPKDKSKDPGPGAIYLSDSPEVQREKLEKCLEAVPYAVGVNNHMGSAFTEDREAMKNIMGMIKDKRLVFVDSYTTSRTVGPEIAMYFGMNAIKNGLFIDKNAKINHICEIFEELVEMSENKKFITAIGHPFDSTFFSLKYCLPLYSHKIQYSGFNER